MIMRYVTSKYEKQLSDLAYSLTIGRYAGIVLQNTVEIDNEISRPPNLRLCNPVEDGWYRDPPEAS